MGILPPTVAEGIRLFNTGKFFEAHEALEVVWLKSRGKKKIFLHGLIQIAAAFHHHARRNRAGFFSLLEKGLKKLEGVGPAWPGIDLDGLRKQLEPWRELLEEESVAIRHEPPLPCIRKAGLRIRDPAPD